MTGRQWKVVSFGVDIPVRGKYKGQFVEWCYVAGKMDARAAYSYFFKLRGMHGPLRVELWRGRRAVLRWKRPERTSYSSVTPD